MADRATEGEKKAQSKIAELNRKVGFLETTIRSQQMELLQVSQRDIRVRSCLDKLANAAASRYTQLTSEKRFI